MKPSRSALFLSMVLLLILAMNCECENPGGFDPANAKVEQYYTADVENPVPLNQYPVLPESGEIEIDFGKVDLGTIRYRYLFLHNSGNSNLKLSQVEFVPGSSGYFFVACRDGGMFIPDCPYSSNSLLEVPPGSDLVVQVSYAPQEVGAHQGSFVLGLNATNRNTVTVHLRGEGVTPEIQVCVTDCTGDQSGPNCAAAPELCNDDVAPNDLEVAFGDADMSTSVRREVILRNRGDQPLQILRLEIFGGDFNQFGLDKNGNVLPGELAAGAQVLLYAIYDPGTGGNHRSSLRVLSNDVNEPEINVVVTGRGLAPRVCPDPLVLDFGNVDTGVPAVKSFTITSCGLLDLQLMDLRMNPTSSQDFSLVTAPALPRTLAPQASIGVDVQYYPLTPGSDSGGVDLYSNDPTSDPATNLTGTVALKGKSVPRACDIQANPPAVNFGGAVVNSAQTFDLVISNQGTDTCTLNDSQITQNSADSEFSIIQAPGPNTDFNPGDTLVVKLQYRPVNLGLDTGILSLFGTDKDSYEIQVDLNGQGVQDNVCDLRVTPTSHNFGLLKVGNTASVTVRLENRGQSVCSISKIELRRSLTQPGDYTLTASPSVPLTLTAAGLAGSQAQVEITFAPGNPGTHRGYLWITSNDPDLQQGSPFLGCIPGPTLGQACVPIQGKADEANIAVVPSELDFGVVTVGCNSPDMYVTVYNLGGITLNLFDIYLQNPSDPNFQITTAPACPYALVGGGRVEIHLRYHPQDLNAHRSTLYIESDASNMPLVGVPLSGRGTNISDQTDVFHQPDRVKSDVLFTVDNSGSMSEEQNALASNFSVFINYAITLNVDFHIGVISVEVNNAETGLGTPPRDVFPGILVQAPNRPKIITNSTPDIINAFGDNVRLGTCCADEQESGLEASWMALSSPFIDDPAKNGGFLRDDAKLYIICLSDEQDQSSGNTDFYVDFFSSIKGYRNPKLMAFSAICGDEPNGCQGAGGEQADSGSRYIEVARRTGGIFQSICTSSWGQALQTLGMDAFTAIQEFPLSRPADSSTISVTVNGVPVPKASCQGCADGWSYYSDTNSIYFGDNCVPNKGDRIEVHYTATCL